MQEILPGVYHWTTFHEGIQQEVHSYFLRALEPPVLIDPRVPDEGLEWFDARPPRHIYLTNRHHFRHSADFAKRFGTKVWCHRAGLWELPAGAAAGFTHGEELPGGVLAVEIGSLCPEETGLYVSGEPGLLALGDSLIREGDTLSFVPDGLMGDDPAGVRHGLRQAFARALELEFDALLLAHGEPLASGGKDALRHFVEAGGRALRLVMDSLDVRGLGAVEIEEVVPDYLARARARGHLQVRVIHGAGHAEQRKALHAVLRELPEVARFELTGAAGAGRNATMVFMRAEG